MRDFNSASNVISYIIFINKEKEKEYEKEFKKESRSGSHLFGNIYRWAVSFKVYC